MKKIAFIIQHLTNGGAERTISNLTLALKDKYDISILIFDGNAISYPYAGKLIDLELPPVNGKIPKFLNVIKRVRKVKNIRKKERYDCVISFMFGGNIVNVLSRCGEKVIVSARNYMSVYGLKKVDVFRERFVAKRADLEIALSQMVKKDLVESFGISENKIKTIYNPCDVEKITLQSKEKCDYCFDKNIFYVVTAGRMVKQKGQWHLIKAFSEFHKVVPNSRLIMLGDGAMSQELQTLSADLGVREYIDFIGFIDNPYCYMAQSSCFVLSSLFEGLGNVIIEAMACKIPVVSYDCLAGPRELISPEKPVTLRANENEWCSCGILVPAPGQDINMSNQLEKSDELLCKALLEVYNNAEEANQIVLNAERRIREFNPENIIDEWKNVL